MREHRTILGSIRYVVRNSRFVKIAQRAIDEYAADFVSVRLLHWSDAYPLGYKPRKSDDDEVDFLFLIASQAFCFWGFPTKWTIFYENMQLDGWWALIACFERALEEGLPVLEGNYLAELNLEQTEHLFRGKPEIPLIKERHEILKKIGKTLRDKYDGRFHNFYRNTEKDAWDLVIKIADMFDGFGDEADYRGKNVYFYKKAQVVVEQFYNIFKDKPYGQIAGMENLTGMADYKIPAQLRKLGILVYNDELAQMVDNRREIPVGSEMEVEIRANMLWATQLICEQLKPKYPEMNSITLHGMLWVQSQIKTTDDKPYHLTKTIYY